MQHWLFKYIAIILFLADIRVGSAEPTRFFLDQEFTLNLGQTAMLNQDKLVIRFKAVLEDSRCPVNAVCVWAGNGKVEIEVDDIDAQRKSVFLNTEEGTKIAVLKKHRLTLISLNPFRRDGVSILPKDYFVKLQVSVMTTPMQ